MAFVADGLADHLVHIHIVYRVADPVGSGRPGQVQLELHVQLEQGPGLPLRLGDAVVPGEGAAQGADRAHRPASASRAMARRMAATSEQRASRDQPSPPRPKPTPGVVTTPTVSSTRPENSTERISPGTRAQT